MDGIDQFRALNILLANAMIIILQNRLDAGRSLSSDRHLQFCDDLSRELCRRFYNDDAPNIVEIDIAIRLQELTLQLAPDQYSRLQALGASFGLRFAAFGELSDLDEAAALHRRAIELLPDNNPTNAAYLACLGVLLWARFDLNAKVEDIQNAVASWAHAVHLIRRLVMDDEAGAVPTAVNHALVLFSRFEAVRQSGLLERTVTALRRKTRESGHRREEARLTLPKLSYLLDVPQYSAQVLSDIDDFGDDVYRYMLARSQWSLTIDTDDLDDAITAISCVVELAPTMDRYQAVGLFNLSMMLLRRFEHGQSGDDLRDAISHLSHAFETLETLSSSEPDLVLEILPGCYTIISRGLVNLPASAGDTLRQLVQSYHRAAARLPEGDAQAGCLFNAGNMYLTCYGLFDDHADLDAAIAVYEKACASESESHGASSREQLSGDLEHFSTALYRRFLLFRAAEDVRRAIEYLRRAIALENDTNSSRIASLHRNLASIYESRFTVFEDHSDAEAAAQERLTAAALAPGESVWFSASAESDISDVALSMHASRIRDMHRASRSDSTDRNTTGVSQRDDNDLANAYADLARRFASRYSTSRQPSHRESAVAAYRDAIDVAPEYWKLLLLNELCRQLREWDSQTEGSNPWRIRRPESLREELEVNAEALKYRGVVDQEYTALTDRLALCEMWRAAVLCFGDPSFRIVGDLDNEEIAVCQRLIDIIPRMASQTYSISRRYEEMARHSIAVRTVVWTAVRLGNPIALQWFEQGRGLVWGQLRNLRTRVDCEQLAVERGYSTDVDNGESGTGRQQLGHAFERVSVALEAASRTGDALGARQLGAEREGLLTQIRSIDGFEAFLQPRSVGELLPACRAGAVVCINAWTEEGDYFSVIIVRPDDQKVQTLNLMHASSRSESWRRRLNLFLGLKPARMRKSRPAAARNNRDDTAQHVLRELWEYVVKPVLEALDIRTDKFPPNSVDLPRITWCTAGSLAFLPLHAAGPYRPGCPNAFDLVVSSYTPNLASLLPNAKAQAQTARPNVLVVAQPDIAGFSSLPGTVKEADTVESLFSDSCVRLDGAKGTVERVFAELGTHNYVHLACHGEQDPEDPLKSSFVLNDGRLTLERLMDIAHSSDSAVGELAFLSACETATGDEKVPDEAVHLAAGMLAVGYRSVVATMWSIGDNHAPLVAGEFYKALLAQHAEDGKTDGARALHAAVATLRKQVGEDQIAKWAPFVHYGV
ncbi:hypothetical protein EXIGLDRAFT_717092 [Exidia glandulosa HHB12029]|uniref:CHAT domain-containing protein n=1 Tax=Exidia glandulosa HHB12029 TaxID=1314781 RepID=A0A165IJH1_EXIGL|nr:hypothetical protein EXIGLDRAFT_717092 [Exidia glandulosa HHB12029]